MPYDRWLSLGPQAARVSERIFWPCSITDARMPNGFRSPFPAPLINSIDRSTWNARSSQASGLLTQEITSALPELQFRSSKLEALGCANCGLSLLKFRRTVRIQIFQKIPSELHLNVAAFRYTKFLISIFPSSPTIPISSCLKDC